MSEAIDIPGSVDRLLESRQKNYPCHANRASSIGDDCLRRLVYERTSWELKAKVDIGLEFAFLIGNIIEEPLTRLVKDAGFTIERTQESFNARGRNGETLLTGHIDGVIRKGDYKAVLEVKTMSPFVWDKIETVADFQRYSWTRKYIHQLNIYCYGLEIPDGIWVLINKSSGRIRQIVWKLDYQLAEEALSKAEEINRHVLNNTIPEFDIRWPVSDCEKCSFVSLCNPPMNREASELIVDETLIKDINEMMSLAESAGRFEILKKELKEKMELIKNAFVGNYRYCGDKRAFLDRFIKLEGGKIT